MKLIKELMEGLPGSYFAPTSGRKKPIPNFYRIKFYPAGTRTAKWVTIKAKNIKDARAIADRKYQTVERVDKVISNPEKYGMEKYQLNVIKTSQGREWKKLIKEDQMDNEYPDEMKKEVARKGAEIADRVYMAGRRWDDSNSKQVDLQIMKSQGRKFVSKGGPRVIDELSKINAEHNANGKEWDKVRAEADSFKKENGFSVVYAWEAANQKMWPYYKMRSGANDKNGSKVKLIES